MSINTTLLLRSIIWLVVTGAALLLAQLWLDLFTDIVFWKLFATVLIIGGVISVVLAIRQDMGEEKKMKDDTYVN